MVNHIEEIDGHGRIACIAMPAKHILEKKDNILTYNIYHYYKYLSEYLNYDKVYIMTTSLEGIEHYENLLKDCNLIYGIDKEDLLLEYHINDLWIVPSQDNLFGGMAVMTFPFCMNRIYEWWKNKTEDDGIIFINDDPQVYKLRFLTYFTERHAMDKNVKIAWNKGVNSTKWSKEIKLLENRFEGIKKMQDDFVVAFCGLDYNKFVVANKIKVLPKAWFNFNVYYWVTLNDDLDLRLKDYPFEDKKYSACYYGYIKDLERIIRTEEFYSKVDKPFLVVKGGNKNFFKNMDFDHDIDVHKNMPYRELLGFVPKNAKSSLITHNKIILGNQVSPRWFDLMLMDIVCFVDENFDPEHNLCDEWLHEYTYCKDGQEYADKLKVIENNEQLYKEIVKRQREFVFKKYEQYLPDIYLNKDKI